MDLTPTIVAPGVACISTGQVAAHIGITVPSAMLFQLGFEPVVSAHNKHLWRESDLPTMRLRLIAMLAGRQT